MVKIKSKQENVIDPKGKDINLINVIQKLNDVLYPLDPESRIRAIQTITILLKIPITSVDLTSGHEQTTTVTGTQPTPKGTPQENITNFMISKKPKDNYQRLACLAYYIDRFQGKIDISVKELKRTNTDARGPNISNISAFLADSTRKYGYFTVSDKGKKRLSARGAVVVDALPDQNAVKVAHQNNPLPKKTGRKRKKKNKK